MSTFTAEQAISHAAELVAHRYFGAEFCFAAGTIVRGRGGEHSDLDLVVLFRELKSAFRESFIHRSMLVEAFVHDWETVQAFMDRDYQDAHPAIIHMITTGKPVGQQTEDAARHVFKTSSGAAGSVVSSPTRIAHPHRCGRSPSTAVC